MIELIVVCAIVAGVIILAGRSFYKTLTGKSDRCGCSTGSCPVSTCCNQWTVPSQKPQEHE